MSKALSKAKNSYYHSSKSDSQFSWNNTNIILPYNASIHSVSNLLPKDQINVTFNYPNSLFKQIVNVHHRTKTDISPGVYKLPCRDCDEVYWGQTGRDLSTRLKEHKNSIRYGQENSAVFLHTSTKNHRIDWSNAAIIFKSHCNFKRKIIESSFIKHHPNFNTSKGQWSPDSITTLAINKLFPTAAEHAPTGCQSSALPHQGHVT